MFSRVRKQPSARLRGIMTGLFILAHAKQRSIDFLGALCQKPLHRVAHCEAVGKRLEKWKDIVSRPRVPKFRFLALSLNPFPQVAIPTRVA
jgi:hypothetical protein